MVAIWPSGNDTDHISQVTLSWAWLAARWVSISCQYVTSHSVSQLSLLFSLEVSVGQGAVAVLLNGKVTIGLAHTIHASQIAQPVAHQ